MAIGWFLCPYKRKTIAKMPGRYCSMDDYTALIRADGGNWTESEVLGNHAIVKVKATSNTLTQIAADSLITRFPVAALDNSLSSLTTNQKIALRNRIEALGYSLSEIQDEFGTDIGNKTLGDVLRFIAKRRRKPRYDQNTDEIILDGIEQSCRPIDELDAEVN